MRYLTFALGKGRLANKTLETFEKIGITCEEMKDKNRESHLVLSYSNNGMISQEEILNIGNSILGKGYKCDLQSREYIHSKMGRSDEYQLDVNELIMSYKKV